MFIGLDFQMNKLLVMQSKLYFRPDLMKYISLVRLKMTVFNKSCTLSRKSFEVAQSSFSGSQTLGSN